MSTRWCFTLFSDDPHPFAPDTEHITYVCFQREACPETGRLHYQGYVEFPVRKQLNTVKRYFTKVHKQPGIHLEIARGLASQCRAYCCKPDTAIPNTFVEYGQISADQQQGRRSDLRSLVDSAQHLAVDRIVIDNPQALRYINHILKLQQYLPSSERDITVHYIWGEPGIGKSRYVWNQVQGKRVSRPMLAPPHIWFQDYVGQDTIILDDIDLRQYPHDLILALLDRYPVSCPTKGGSTPARYTTVYITSNIDPKNFPLQLTRRMQVVRLAGEGTTFAGGARPEGCNAEPERSEWRRH